MKWRRTMDRQGVKVFLAVAIGVGLGILAGREVHAAVGWLVGALIGGAAGYVTVAPVAVLTALPRAWVTVRGWPIMKLFEVVRWWLYASVCMPMLICILCHSMILARGGGWDEFVRTVPPLPEFLAVVAVITVFLGIFIGLYMSGFIPTDDGKDIRAVAHQTLDGSIATARFFVKGFAFLLPYVSWLLATRGLPRLARFSARLGVAWFRLVHSDLRLLCLADAFLFAGVGTLVGGPILAWMLAGGAFGALNYEVVSKRWLKLAPVTVRRD